MNEQRDEGGVDQVASSAGLRRLDAGLAEVLGGEVVPDLTEVVRARHVAGSRAHASTNNVSALKRGLVAAVLVLGVGVIAAVAGLGRAVSPSEEERRVPMAPPVFVDVSSRAEIEALPPETKAVRGTNLGDDDVRALERLEQLEALELQCPAVKVVGLGLKSVVTELPASITEAGLANVARLESLRSLRLVGTYLMGEALTAGANLDVLANLQHLEELELSYLDASDRALAVLPQFPRLERLRLVANHGFSTGGLRAIAGCRQLREVSLRYCQQLSGRDLALLGGVPTLEVVDLGGLDRINWRSSLVESGRPGPKIKSAGAVGVTDATLLELAGLPALRVLRISHARCTSKGLAALSRRPALRELDLFGVEAFGDDTVDLLPRGLEVLRACGDFSDATCVGLARLPSLRELSLPACYEIGDVGLGELVRVPTLRVLRITQCRGFTEKAMAELSIAHQLEELDVRHIDWFGEKHAATLRASLPRLRQFRF